MGTTMRSKISVLHVSSLLIALLALLIMLSALVSWRQNMRVTSTAVRENGLNMELGYALANLQSMDDIVGVALYAQDYELDDIAERFRTLNSETKACMARFDRESDLRRYYYAQDIATMLDTYQNEAEEFFANRKAGQTAPVFLRGERFDLATLNQYIKDEMSKMITYHLNLSKDAMMETVEGLQGSRDLILIFALICLFASTMVVFTLMRTVMHPIRQIVRGVDHFKETGNKEGMADLRGSWQEISKLFCSFDAMMDDILEKQENERYMAKMQIDYIEMQHKLDRAKLHLLQAQVNPHFLFNTLNAIYALAIKENAEHTGEMVAALSSIMRYSLSSFNRFSTVEHEMRTVMDYIYIQRLRFGDTIEFVTSVEPGLEDEEIPAMMVQPIVENSIMHAFTTRGSADRIEIRVFRLGDDVCIQVRDNGVGMDAARIESIFCGDFKGDEDNSHHGIGLDNIISRMELLYGKGHIRIESQPGAGTCVTLLITKQSKRGALLK